MSRLLILIEEDEAAPLQWLSLTDDGGVGQRGVLGDDPLPWLPEGQGWTCVAAAPATAVVLHQVNLPAVTAAQSQAAARLIAADIVAMPVDRAHVVLDEGGDGVERMLAVVDRDAVAGWLARLAVHGIDPQWLVPLPLLLPEPGEGSLVVGWRGLNLVRGPGVAYGIEADLDGLLSPPAPVARIGEAEGMALVARGAMQPPLNLRQGPFRRARRLPFDRKRIGRLGWLAAASLVVALAVPLAEAGRYAFIADRLEQRAEVEARRALPRGAAPGDAVAQLRARVAAMGGAGGGFLSATAALFGAMQAAPATRLRSLGYEGDGTLTAVIDGSGGDGDAIRNALLAAGRTVDAPQARSDDGTAVVELVVRAR
jgi:general secretion pathway protein L